MLQYYDFTITANGYRTVSAPGTYLRYYKGSANGADPSILVKNDTMGVAAILKPGQAIRLPASERGAVDWIVSNYAQAAPISGILAIGDGQLDDSTVSGEISLINGEVSRVLAGKCFAGYSVCAAVAGQYSHCILYNPAGSGKNLILDRAAMLMPTAGTVGLSVVSALLAVAANNTANKLVNTGGRVGDLRAGTFASAQGNPFFNLTIPANESREFAFSEPFVIPPTYGLAAYGMTANIQLTANWQWKEEA